MTRDARVSVRFVGGVHDGTTSTIPKRFVRPGLRLRMPSTVTEHPLRALTAQKPLVSLPPSDDEKEQLVVVPNPCVYVLEDRDGEIIAVYQPPGGG